MAAKNGRDQGHQPATSEGGFEWAAYVDWIVEQAGGLSAAAERLCAHRGYVDDVASAERALRRLRARGSRDGGRWGQLALQVFGVPGQVLERVRWMATFHSRFTDLPVPLCADLVRVWDRPPVNGSRPARAFLAVAHASLALRRDQPDEALAHLARARADLLEAPALARIEALLIRAYVASRRERNTLADLLASAAALIAEVDDADDRACLAVRLVDHETYVPGERQTPAELGAAEAKYRALADSDAPPFARARRAAGIAYAAWRQGRNDEARSLALAAAEHAGDGGHVRARAMALLLLARIVGGQEGAAGRQRAEDMSRRLDDETLRLRVARGKRG